MKSCLQLNESLKKQHEFHVVGLFSHDFSPVQLTPCDFRLLTFWCEVKPDTEYMNYTDERDQNLCCEIGIHVVMSASPVMGLTGN